MDSVTHIVLGACIGEALLGRKVGKRAMFLGAAAQSIPDIDFITSFWLDTTENLLAHRGFTHSLLFTVLITPLLALLAERMHRPHNISLTRWIVFFGTEILIHLFLDAFNNYGVGWFEPFNHSRISFNVIYVADPLFTLIPAIAFVVLIAAGRNNKNRKHWWKMAIFMCFAYLVFSLFNKYQIDIQARNAFREQQIPHERYFTTPAPLQNLLWMVVAGNDSGYHVGYRSLFDSRRDITFRFYPRNENKLIPLLKHKDVINLIRFSKGFYTVEQWSDTLVFNDLRFGQIIGWQDPKEKFVFHYYLEHPTQNILVVQRGRFAKWDLDIFRSFIKRIKGI